MSDKSEWYILVNPTAGGGRVRRRWPHIQSQLDDHSWRYTLGVTEYPGHATELVRQAIQEGYRHFLAVGGDGTNNEAINGIFSQKAVASTELHYALLPIGTGNDRIKAHGIPRQPAAVLAMLRRGQYRYQDVGWVSYHRDGQKQERYFVNVAGMGYDAFVVQRAVASGRRGGSLGYLWQALRGLIDYELRPARVRFDDREIEAVFYTIHAGIAPYSGGGMRFVPHAQLDDGRLALTLIREIAKPKVLANLYRLYNGSIGQLAEVEQHYARHIRVDGRAGKATSLEVDGEFLGETPVEFRILEKALRVVVP